MTNPVYLEQMIPEYQGNPLIEGLPRIHDTHSAIEILGNYPLIASKEREWPDELRYHLIGRLADLVQPLTDHFSVEQKVSRLIRRGYICRNPLSAITLQHRHYLNMRGADGVPDAPSFMPTTSAMALTGMSGMGKTTMANSILSTYPQTIRHSAFIKGAPSTKPKWSG